jgi:hypothetical protein
MVRADRRPDSLWHWRRSSSPPVSPTGSPRKVTTANLTIVPAESGARFWLGGGITSGTQIVHSAALRSAAAQRPAAEPSRHDALPALRAQQLRPGPGAVAGHWPPRPPVGTGFGTASRLAARGCFGVGGPRESRQPGPQGPLALRLATIVVCPPAATNRGWVTRVRSMGIWAPQVSWVPPRTAQRLTLIRRCCRRMTCTDLEALGVELIAADDAGDARRLAAIAWRLYAEAGLAQAEIERLHGVLRSFRSPGGDRPPAAGGPRAPSNSRRASTNGPPVAGRGLEKRRPAEDVCDASPDGAFWVTGTGPRLAGVGHGQSALSGTWPWRWTVADQAGARVIRCAFC